MTSSEQFPHALIVVALTCVAALALHWSSDAQARLPWKTDQWQIACKHRLKESIVRPDEPAAQWAVEFLNNEIDEPESWVEKYFGGDREAALSFFEDLYRKSIRDAEYLCEPTRSDLLARIDDQLEWGSHWLQGMGFSGPAISPENEKIEGRFFPESLTDCAANYCASVGFLGLGGHGRYYGSTDSLEIGIFAANALVPSDEIAPGRELDAGNVQFAYTPLHELFHAVQFAYEGLDSAPKGVRWFTEGTARHVQLVGAGLRGSLADTVAETRYYDHPLHVPPDSGDWLHQWKYGSWYFWDFLGAELDSQDGVKYLDTILRHDLSDENGLVGVHSALEMMHPTGLYDLFPAFVQRRLLEEKYFETVSEHQVQIDDRELIMGQRVEPMAANAHRVEYELANASAAGLSVRLSEDHPDLHLVVDRERADAMDGDGSDRNVWRTHVSESGEIFVRVANAAPYPPDSEERSYDLEISLVPVEPCSQDAMVSVVNEDRTYLGPFRASKRFADPAIPERAREFLSEQTQQLEPGVGALQVSGVISDGGVGCSGHVGATSLTGRLMAGDESAEDEFVARMEKMAEGAEALVEQAEGLDETTPEQAREMAEKSRALQEEFASDSEGHEQSVVFPVYSPNAWVWQTGLLSEADFVRHAGAGGWRANAAAHFVIHLPDTGPDEIREGGVYEATAYGVEMSDMDDVDGVSTPNGFYTRWTGEFAKIPYPQPRDARAARRQEQERARCRQLKESFIQMRNRLPVGNFMTGEGAEKRDCDFQGTAFAGRLERVFGQLNGRVTVDEMTGAEIHGRFELSGTARVERSDFEFQYDGDGRLIGDREETSSQRGNLRIEGTLRAPNQRHGQARFGWEAIVIR